MNSEYRSAPTEKAAKSRTPLPRPFPSASSSRGATATELLVVLMFISVLGAMSIASFLKSRKETDIAKEAWKIDKNFATARSYAALSEDRYFQVTFWLTAPSYWIDEIEISDPTDFTTVPALVQRQITTPEKIHHQLEITDFVGGIPDPETNTRSFRFFPDGTSDEATIFLLRKEDSPSGGNYYKVKLYGPTAKATVFENVTNP